MLPVCPLTILRIVPTYRKATQYARRSHNGEIKCRETYQNRVVLSTLVAAVFRPHQPVKLAARPRNATGELLRV